jgi:hypothetical protein
MSLPLLHWMNEDMDYILLIGEQLVSTAEAMDVINPATAEMPGAVSGRAAMRCGRKLGRKRAVR